MGWLCLFFLTTLVLPSWWCSRGAGAWYAGDLRAQEELGRGVERWVTRDLQQTNFDTGSPLFNGEWLFGTYMMAGMGFAQTAREHPELKARHLKLIETCIERMLSQPVRQFDRDSWNHDPLETQNDGFDRAAYLGYGLPPKKWTVI